MNDEYPLANKKHNPDPTQYAREFEVEHLREENERLEQEISNIKREAEDRLASVEARLVEWDRRYSYGKGLIAGMFIVFGIFGVFVVDTVKDILAHLHDYIKHNAGPP